MSSSFPSISSSPARSKPEAGAGPGAGAVKRRACDECRARKLACSKEPHGCSRCRKEGLQCVYSTQKPMGRPPKRKHLDEPKDERAARLSASSQHHVTQSQLEPQIQMDDQLLDPLDLSFSSFDGAQYNSSLDMFYLDATYPAWDESLTTSTLSQTQVDLTRYAKPQLASDEPQQISVQLFDGTDSYESDVTECQAGNGYEVGALDPVLDLQGAQPIPNRSQPPTPISVAGPSNRCAGESTNASSSASSSSSQTLSRSIQNLKSLPQTSCACLSRIYLALDSLARLPDNVAPAMHAARTAASTALDVSACPSCSFPLMQDPRVPPPMQSYQNMMLLGILLPTIANAYVRILEIVEAATFQAKEVGGKMTLRFADYCGPCSNMGEHDRDSPSCQLRKFHQDEEEGLDPDQWRLFVHALLKRDIYGARHERSSVEASPAMKSRHLGLKDVIAAMEERSNRRHDYIDALVAAGHPHPVQYSPYNLLCSLPATADQKKEDRQCLKIVEMARSALDKLVIA